MGVRSAGSAAQHFVFVFGNCSSNIVEGPMRIEDTAPSSEIWDRGPIVTYEKSPDRFQTTHGIEYRA